MAARQKPAISCATQALASTFRTLAKEGRDAFYAGAIAEDIVGELRQRGSLLTLEDLARTEASWVEPISTPFAGHEILEIPPNGQGITALDCAQYFVAFRS